ncbi:MAG: hypothetical protein M3Q65_26565, partial [Chloroflexota bacterium]|nr:hypothetical protein [Chloroflexota bacterium]
ISLNSRLWGRPGIASLLSVRSVYRAGRSWLGSWSGDRGAVQGEAASGSAPGSMDASASASERAAGPAYTFPQVYGDDEAPGLVAAPGIG